MYFVTNDTEEFKMAYFGKSLESYTQEQKLGHHHCP